MDDNKKLVREWFERVWNQKDCLAIKELMADDAVGHVEGGPVGPDDFMAFAEQFQTMFPDLHLDIEWMIAEGDQVATRWIMVGHHAGDVPDLKATGRRVAIRGTSWMTVDDNKIVGGYDTWNQGHLMNQIGAPRSAIKGNL